MRPHATSKPTYQPYKPIYTIQTNTPIFTSTQQSTPVFTLQTYKPTYPTNNKPSMTTRKAYKPIFNFHSTRQPYTTTTLVTSTRRTTKKPPYTGPPTYKPTYRPGFHLTPTRPMYSTKPVPTYSTTPSIYKPTFKPAVLATFKPEISFTASNQYMNTTTTKNPFPIYPFPILPDFDPVTKPSTKPSDEDLDAVIIEAGEDTTTETADITIPGIEGVAIPGSADAMVEYVTSIMNQLRVILPFSEDSTDQESAQSMAAISTVVGLPMLTGVLAALGAGPAVVIAVAWLLPIGLLMVTPGFVG
jgi:hypothetical protein